VEELRCGVVGLRRGLAVARAVDAHPACRITAVCDSNEQRACKAADSFDADAYSHVEEMLGSDIHALIVATPPESHAELSMTAARRGKHVLCEVPAVARLEEALPLKQAVEEAGTVYMLAENMCFFSNIETMHALVEAGRIGNVYYAEGEYIHDCRELFQYRDDGLGGGTDGNPTWRVGLPPIRYTTHELGPLLMMLRDPVVSVVAMHTGRHGAPPFDAIDMEVALLKTRSGGVIKLLCGFAAEREPAFHFLSLYGTGGSVETDRYRPYDVIKAYFADVPYTRDLIEIPVSRGRPKAPPEARLGGHGTSEYYMVDAFVRRIREGAPGPLGVSEALNISVPGICAHRSAEQGGAPVEVPVY
jgi:predicted dehydrogenase